MEASTTQIYDSLDVEYQPSFYQLVHYPVIASANVNRLLVYAGMNNLRASQAFLSANNYGDRSEELFENDYDLETDYHSLLDGI